MGFNDLILGLNAVLPELILSLVIAYLLIVDMFCPVGRSRRICGSLSLLGLFMALSISAVQFQYGQLQASPVYFEGLIILDRGALFFKALMLAGAFLSLAFSMRSSELENERFGEYCALLLGATLGGCLLASAGNLLIFLLAMETLSLCSYVLAAFSKRERFSAEAGLKYTLFGAVASAVMLFGMSYLYGLSGSLDIQRSVGSLVPAFLMKEAPLPAYFAFMLVLTGVGFKIAVLPFHFWCPDTYQGAPTPVTAFLSVVSKVAGFAALSRLLLPVVHAPLFQAVLADFPAVTLLQLILGVLALLTMTFGNLVAVRQSNVKRLLAYSAIAHAGYLLMALTVMRSVAFEAVALYLLIYLFMNLGAFWSLIAIIRRTGSAELQSMRGLAFTSPLLFACFFVFLVSLTGLPPTAGFAAKFQLFQVVVSAGLAGMAEGSVFTPISLFYLVLVLAALLNSVVSLYYYMKIAKAMVFEKPEEGVVVPVCRGVDALIALLLAVPVILLLNFGPAADMLGNSFGLVKQAQQEKVPEGVQIVESRHD